MFPDLLPFTPSPNATRGQAKKLGEKDGFINALNHLTYPIQSVTNPRVLSPSNLGSFKMTATDTAFGQSINCFTYGDRLRWHNELTSFISPNQLNIFP